MDIWPLIHRVVGVWLRRGRAHANTTQPSSPPSVPVTVVTGASGSIGAAIAEAFAASLVPSTGRLVLTGRDATALGALARRLSAAHLSLDVQTCVADLADPSQRARLLTMARQDNGHIVCLCNVAGLGHSGPLAEQDPDRLDELLAVNVTALTALTRDVLPDMIARRAGGILNIASLGGFAPGPGQAAYYASKAYVISLSEALAEELAGTGVRVVCLAPGAVTSPFHTRMGVGDAWYRSIPGEITPERVAQSAVAAYALATPLQLPGVVPRLYALALRVLPHTLTVPILARLLRERARAGDESEEINRDG